MSMSRRSFLATAGALVATGTPGVRAAMAMTGAYSGDMLVVVFLRGAADGLSMVAPVNDGDYVANRPSIRLRDATTNVGLQLANGPNAGALDWRIHGNMGGFRDLYQQGSLGIVHATGLVSSSRSHFDAQDFMERGIADNEAAQGTGWLTRHLEVLGAAGVELPVVAASSSIPRVLQGNNDGVAINTPASFALYNATTDMAIYNAMMTGTTQYAAIGRRTINATKTVNAKLPRDAAGRIVTYQPQAGLAFGTNGLGTSLSTVAQLVKMDLGLQVATVDYGGWDHHDSLVAQMNNVARTLSAELTTFWNDLSAYQSRLTVVVMTEFGRRFKENSSGGLDHGHGSVMFTLGGAVNGGKIHGQWPGLGVAALDETRDLAITTDYRRVLSEILVNRAGNTNIGAVFPTVPWAPIGIVRGAQS